MQHIYYLSVWSQAALKLQTQICSHPQESYYEWMNEWIDEQWTWMNRIKAQNTKPRHFPNDLTHAFLY